MTIGRLIGNMRAQDVVTIVTTKELKIYSGEVQHMDKEILDAVRDREVVDFFPRQDIVTRTHKIDGSDPVRQFRAGVYEFKDILMVCSMEVVIR